MSKAFIEKSHIEGGEIIRQIVFGANDGIVSIFALLAGVAGANQDPRTILITLLAATIAGALSMAAGEYVSGKSERNYFENEIRQEKLELNLVPEIEKEELKLIYKQKGFSGKNLDDIIETITQNEDLWLKELIINEMGIAEIEQEGEIKGTIVIFFSFIIGAIFPTLPYLIFQSLPGNIIFWIATIVTFFGLFLVGALKKFVTGVNWLKSGIEMLIAGTFAFGVSFLIGQVLGVAV
jgi:VIT1/CCC1 family predicted Fe2+/Mn2+ transporter